VEPTPPPAPPRKRSRWPIVLGAILAVILVLVAIAVIVAFTWFDVSLNDGVGNRSDAPTAASDVHRQYKLGVGDLKLDLSRVPTDRELDVSAHVGIGNLRVIVPESASVDARVKVGSIDAPGRHDDGQNAEVRLTGRGNVHLEARVGAGHIEVVSR
jgi:predicted membrane protein